MLQLQPNLPKSDVIDVLALFNLTNYTISSNFSLSIVLMMLFILFFFYIWIWVIISFEDRQSVFDVLSSREREVLKLIAEGKDSKEIASTLRISPKTVKAHRANIMKKLGIHKLAELVTYAIKMGLVEI